MSKIYLSILLLFFACEAYADVYMWLPVSYQEQDEGLSKAVDLIMDTERCDQALKATINQDRSTVEHPIFKVLCRDKDRATYWELVDGVSFTVVNDLAPDADDPIVLAAEAKLKTTHRWRTCQAMLDQRYINFSQVKLLTKTQPQEVVKDDNSTLFYVDFDAVSSFGVALKYRAVCTFKDSSDYFVRLRPRPES